MVVEVLGGIIFVKHGSCQKNTVLFLPTLNGHGEEYQLDYVSTEDSALEILDYIKANCGGKLFAIGGVSLGGQIAIELLSSDSEIAEKVIIDGSLCIPQPRLAKISIFLVSLFGKLMFNKISCKLQLSMMNKLYPKLAYPEEIKHIIWRFAKDAYQNIGDHLQKLYGMLQAEGYDFC